MENEKCIFEWFLELPEPYRSQALENLIDSELDKGTWESTSKASALAHGFYWSGTPQKHKYWSKLHKRLGGKW